MEPTPKAEIEKRLASLDARRHAWAGLSLGDRIRLLDQLNLDFAAENEAWWQASIRAKSLTDLPQYQGQEWLGGPCINQRYLRCLKKTLVQVRKHGNPVIPGPVRERGDGQITAQVFPVDFYDKLFFPDTTAEIWMEPGIAKDSLNKHLAVAYQKPRKSARICLVLGGGNVSSIAPMDCLFKLFVEKRLVILKMHRVNDYLGPILERAFRCLIEKGFLAIVYGGGEEGEFLCNHEKVDEILITGSDKTHDLIVFGPEVAKAKAERKPRNTKPITSELGNVSPVIVVPGEWRQHDLEFQAENLVSSLVNNAGFNCNATRVIITHESWPQREAFLDEIRKHLQNLATRAAYYPGAADRFAAFREAHPEAELFGKAGGEALPWMLIPDLDPENEDERCYRTEAFCGLFGETPLGGDTTAEFLEKAVAFANERLWGTLNATLIVDPGTANSDGGVGLEKAIASLRYGTVSVNHWAALGYGLCVTTWGAFPGHDRYDIQSGSGLVHNSTMFDRAQKSVIRGPFRVSPKPAWFVSHRKVTQLGRRLAAFEAKPSIFRLPAIIAAALGG